MGDRQIAYDDHWNPPPEGYQEEDYERRSFPLMNRKTIAADRRRQASYIVSFSNSWCPQYFIRVDHEQWDEYFLSPVILDWLTAHTSDVIIPQHMDRGDFGEGEPICELDFAVEAEADAFYKEFNHIVNAYALTRSGMSKRFK